MNAELLASAMEMRDALAAIGLVDRAFCIDSIIARAQKNEELEKTAGEETLTKTATAIKSISERLGWVLEQYEPSNSDVLAALEDSSEDLFILQENADKCPDFITKPASTILSAAERSLRRIRPFMPLARVSDGVLNILNAAVKGAARYG